MFPEPTCHLHLHLQSLMTTITSWHNRFSVLRLVPQDDVPPDPVDDLTIEILSRLPVKSLLQFSFVSHSWNHLISSSDFSNYHLRRLATDPPLLDYRLLEQRVTQYSCFRLNLRRSLRSIIGNPSSSLFPPFISYSLFDDVLSFYSYDPVVVGSINGLVCWFHLSSFKSLSPDPINPYLYRCDEIVNYLNPSTSLKSRSPRFRSYIGRNCFTTFGFGHDHITDIYKTVAMYCNPKADKIEDKVIVKVYTLGGARSWRRMRLSFPFVPWHRRREDNGKFVSGTVNWLATRPDSSLFVVSIDIGKETCQEVLLPDVARQGLCNVRPKLLALGDYLCFSYHSRVVGVQFVLWQMKVFGVSESWTMLKLNLSYVEYRPEPIFMLDKDEVLLKMKTNGFFLYDTIRNQFNSIEFQNFMSWREGITHIESLVSPSPCSIVVN